jgi:hypothetical protein
MAVILHPLYARPVCYVNVDTWYPVEGQHDFLMGGVCLYLFDTIQQKSTAIFDKIQLSPRSHRTLHRTWSRHTSHGVLDCDRFDIVVRDYQSLRTPLDH